MKTVGVVVIAVVGGAVGACLLMRYCKKKKCKCCGDKSADASAVAGAPGTVTATSPVAAPAADPGIAQGQVDPAVMPADGGHGPNWPSNATAKAWAN